MKGGRFYQVMASSVLLLSPSSPIICISKYSSSSAGLKSSFLGSSHVPLSSPFVPSGSLSTNEKLPGGLVVRSEVDVWNRLGRVFRSYARSAGKAMEDPSQLLENSVREMEKEVRKVFRTADEVESSILRLEQRESAANQESGRWRDRAKRALLVGDELMAREALSRCQDYEGVAKSLKEQRESQSMAAKKLSESARILNGKLGEAMAKKEGLQARVQAAKASRRVQELVQNLDTGGALASFERAKMKVEEAETEASAITELATDSLDDRFLQLESVKNNEEIETRMTQLKVELKEELKSVPVFESERERERENGKGILLPSWLERRASDYMNGTEVTRVTSSKNERKGQVLRNIEIEGDDETPTGFVEKGRGRVVGSEVRREGGRERASWGNQSDSYNRGAFGYKGGEEVEEGNGFFQTVPNFPWAKIVQFGVQLALATIIGPFAFLPLFGNPGFPVQRMGPPILGPMGQMGSLGQMSIPISPLRPPIGFYGRGNMGISPRGPIIVRRFGGYRRF